MQTQSKINELTNKNIHIMTIKPLADRVLVRPAEAEQKTASGIIIPDTAKEKPASTAAPRSKSTARS